jgi:sporulation protein YlmC with PRC-barrel domain
MRKILCILALSVLVIAGAMTDVQSDMHGGDSMKSSSPTMGTSGAAMSQTAAKGYERAYQTSETIGMKVKSQQGQDLGKIQDVVYDSSGRIAFVVVSTSGVAGMKDKKVAVPFTAMRVSQDGKEATLNISKDKLESARTWDKSILRDSSAAADIFRHFGQQPYWESTSPQQMQRSTPSIRDTAPGSSTAPGSTTSPPQGGSRY